MASPDPGQALKVWENAFGRMWPAALKELSAKGCLPAGAQVVAAGIGATNAKLLMDGLKDKGFQKNFFSLHSDLTRNDFQASLLDETSEFRETLLFGGDQQFAAELTEAVGVLAMQLVNTQGLGHRDAIERAAKAVINDKYSIQAVNGAKFRVPSQFDGALIELGAARALMEASRNPDAFHTADLTHLGEHGGWLYRSYLAKNGRFVTNGDESGLYLFVGGSVVRDKKTGDPVMFSWEELAELGGKADGGMNQYGWRYEGGKWRILPK